jgi:hypothetical protein
VFTFQFALFSLAALTSLACTVLLFRGYSRTRVRLLLWSALCFVFLTINNVLLFVDIIIAPAVDVDLRVVRQTAALIGVGCLLYAFIWEAE